MWKSCVSSELVELLRREFAAHPEIPAEDLEIRGAVYDIESGEVRWLDETDE